MKTANLPFRPAIVLSLIAGLTVTTGLLPVSSTAQEASAPSPPAATFR